MRKPRSAPPAAMQPLAVLPVFHDLNGKAVTVIGATEGAAWKVELLLAAGAHVTAVVDQEPDAFDQIKQRGDEAAQRLTHKERPWVSCDFIGAVMIIADAVDDAEARVLQRMARRVGVPVNIIDRPRYCDFSFGAIVNRSPIVVGISSAGAAPVLGQAVRRRIETLLPPGLKNWAGAARALRAKVMATLTDGSDRRAFWRAYAERAFQMPNHEAPLREAEAWLAAPEPNELVGRVTLVGAGPGDAELLTLKAVRALQAADVILFDDLVSDDVLELARREAKRMVVGKRGQRPSCKQEEINGLMLKLAGQGKHVVRLKSGDPMIFGRAGEEIADLEAAGIAVDVVPGITAALGAAAALGVSLTHRDFARSVRFVTGHARTGELPEDLDWSGLADPKTTLMIYMGGRTAPKLAQKLIDHGLSSAMSVCILSNVSRPDQSIQRTNLDELAAGALIKSEGPVLLGVGTAFEAVSSLEQTSALPLCMAR